MIIEFGQKSVHKYRIWLDELPALGCENGESESRTFSERSHDLPVRQFAAVELYIPYGGSYYTGILGAEYRAHEGNNLTAIVHSCKNISDNVEWAYASKIDNVRSGLLSEYVPAIFKALSSLDNFCAGTLVINRAAHSPVGSAPIVFEWLTQILIYAFQNNELLDTEVDKVVKTSFARKYNQ